MRFIAASIKFLPLTILLLLTGALQAADVSPSEYKLKAAFIYHFSQFVDWPAKAFPDANAPFVIGVLGENPFGADLEQTVNGKSMGSHPLKVKEFHSLAEAQNNCHILFISSSEQSKLPEIVSGLGTAGILTVGEADNFGDAGGMIQFVIEGGKMRFRINETITAKANLKVSAKLLSLASHTAK